ncbi:MAG: hypothetical protein U9Q34_07440, partial [Elusimicrobiota bacterium]|nr:hypothetical protein [Elusimicrobiota bacterium]
EGSKNKDEAIDKLLNYVYLESEKQSGEEAGAVTEGLSNTDKIDVPEVEPNMKAKVEAGKDGNEQKSKNETKISKEEAESNITSEVEADRINVNEYTNKDINRSINRFISKKFNGYNLNKNFEDFNQDDMAKLLIAANNEVNQKQWIEIKNVLRIKAKADNTDLSSPESLKIVENYKFMLKAEELCKSFNKKDIAKVVKLRKDLFGINEDTVELSLQGNQDDAVEARDFEAETDTNKTINEINNFISKELKDYNLDKNFEDFNQDDMLKLLIICKTKDSEKQWGNIKKFLKTERDAKPLSGKNKESHIFALKAENVLKSSDKKDIKKAIDLSLDLGINNNDKIIKLFLAGCQKDAREVLKETYKTEGEPVVIEQEVGADTSESEVPTEEPLGLKKNFSLELGKGEVPAQLERVFSMMAADSMKDILGAANADGVKMFDEEEGSKILNVAANLVRLSEGKDTAGIEVDSLKDILNWDAKSQKLEIKNYQKFNELVKNLHEHADQLWKDEVLQKGAAAHLDDIENKTWEKIIHAEGLEKVGDIETGIEGHNDIKANQIADFEN